MTIPWYSAIMPAKGAKDMAYSEASKKATLKYRAENIDRIMIDQPRGTKDRWKAAASAKGESLAEFVRKAVEERLARDAAHNPAAPVE